MLKKIDDVTVGRSMDFTCECWEKELAENVNVSLLILLATNQYFLAFIVKKEIKKCLSEV